MTRQVQPNRYQQNAVKPRFTVKGVYIARLLAGFLLFLNVILILAILISPNGLPGYRKQNRQVKELEGKVLKLRADNQKLFEMIQALKTSPKVQEKLVRRELGWVGENEIILEFPDRENRGAVKAVVPIKPFSLPK